MQTAFLFYAQPLNNGICAAYEYFLRLPLFVMPIQILSVNKRLRNLATNSIIAKSSSICAKTLWATSSRPFGEVGLLYNFHGEHILLKLKM